MSCPFVSFLQQAHKTACLIDALMQDLDGLVTFDPPLPKDEPSKAQRKSNWTVTLDIEANGMFRGHNGYRLSAHGQLQLKQAEHSMLVHLRDLQRALVALCGYFTDPIEIGFERRHNGMVFLFMGYALKDLLSPKPTTSALLPILKRLHGLQRGTGRYKMGSHVLHVASMDDMILIHMLLSAPKSAIKRFRKPKPLAEIHRVWTYEEVMEAQAALLRTPLLPPS